MPVIPIDLGLDLHMAVKGARGGVITGDSDAVGHVGEIRILDYGLGITVAALPGGKRGVFRPNLSPVVVTKVGDSSSTKLMGACYNADSLTVTLTQSRAGDSAASMEVVLSGSRLRSVRTTVADSGDVLESLTFTYDMARMQYRPQLATGLLGAAKTAQVTNVAGR